MELSRSVNSLQPLIDSAGTWSFSGIPWRFSVQKVEPHSIDERLVSPVIRDTFPEHTRAGEVGVIQFLEAMNCPSEKTDQGRRFRFEEDDLRAVVETITVVGDERINIARLAFRDEKHWSLVEVSCDSGESKDGKQVEHLLPLPFDARQVCARRSGDGSLLLEAINVEATIQELLHDWKTAGWEIQWPASTNSEYGTVQCYRGKRTVTVIGTLGESKDGLQLFLFDPQLIR